MKIKIVNAPKGTPRSKLASGCTELRIDSKRVAVACVTGAKANGRAAQQAVGKRPAPTKATARERKLRPHIIKRIVDAAGHTQYWVGSGDFGITFSTLGAAQKKKSELDLFSKEARKSQKARDKEIARQDSLLTKKERAALKAEGEAEMRWEARHS